MTRTAHYAHSMERNKQSKNVESVGTGVVAYCRGPY